MSNVGWAKLIWNACIPPAKSLFAWKMFLSKIPTYEILARRGWLMLPYKCELCGTRVETSENLFFHYNFAQSIWNWLSNIIQLSFHFNFSKILEVCNQSWSMHCKVVILSSIINTFNTIWYCRNQRKFHNKTMIWNSALNIIITNVNLSGILFKANSSCNMSDFRILKAFKVTMPPPKASRIIEVI